MVTTRNGLDWVVSECTNNYFSLQMVSTTISTTTTSNCYWVGGKKTYNDNRQQLNESTFSSTYKINQVKNVKIDFCTSDIVESNKTISVQSSSSSASSITSLITVWPYYQTDHGWLHQNCQNSTSKTVIDHNPTTNLVNHISSNTSIPNTIIYKQNCDVSSLSSPLFRVASVFIKSLNRHRHRQKHHLDHHNTTKNKILLKASFIFVTIIFSFIEPLYGSTIIIKRKEEGMILI